MPIFLALDGLWLLVLFMALTVRGRLFRQRAYSSRYERLLPSIQTLQVVLLAVWVMLCMCLLLHHSMGTSTLGDIILVAIIAGIVGIVFIAVANHWIRGESLSLRNALLREHIDRQPAGWAQGVASSDELMDDTREYRQVRPRARAAARA